MCDKYKCQNIATNPHLQRTLFKLQLSDRRCRHVMDVEINPTNSEDISLISLIDIGKIFQALALNDKVIFKSQQRGEEDLNADEKRQIAQDIFNNSKMNFINRFGKHFTLEELEYLQQYETESGEGYEIKLLLRPLIEHARNLRLERKNRRYEALKQLIDENSYFSEVEMMKRNPLLYEQLVGQYLSLDERKERDGFHTEATSFVSILMEGIERDNADVKKKTQQENEDNAMEEEDDDSDDDNPAAETTSTAFEDAKPSTSKWGEFHDSKIDEPIRRYASYQTPQKFITKDERELLKNEFVTLMHRSFLDGKDEEFDYDSVDNNETYDNIDIIDHDKEDKYFDDEEPEYVDMNEQRPAESSEDELDIYMNALNQHPAVCQLSQDLKRL